jgi:hypothetical protein
MDQCPFICHLLYQYPDYLEILLTSKKANYGKLIMEDFNTKQAMEAGNDNPNFWNVEIIANLFDCTDSKIVLLWYDRNKKLYFEAEMLTDELDKKSTNIEIDNFVLRNWNKFYFELPY